MKTEVLVPQIGHSISNGTIATWFKKVGDKVERGESLFEISTDLVDVEIPAPVSGYLVEILHRPGTTVKVNKVVAYISDQLSDSVSKPAERSISTTFLAKGAEVLAVLKDALPKT